MAEPAFDHLREARDESEATGRRVLAAAQDAARRTGESVRRAGAHVQTGMARMGQRAQHLAHDADDRIEQLTGHPIEAWPAQASRAVREHPLRALAATVGLGYVVGKILWRGRSRAGSSRTRPR